MDSGKYREIMTNLFFRGEVPPDPPPDSEPSERGGSKRKNRKPTPPRKSKVDELRAFNERIAARRAAAE
jgi:hypothetical protein